jgi:RNAse (barnase) inhibitor barstar
MKATLQHRLIQAEGAGLHILKATSSDAFDHSTALSETKEQRIVSRVVRGSHAESLASFFNEISAALQFPPYFGHNLNALDECLGDLEWLPADKYVLFFLDADRLLKQEKPEIFQSLIKLLNDVAHERKSIGFQIVLQTEGPHVAELETKLKATGVKFTSL